MTTISRAGSGVLLVLQLWSALAIAQEPAVQAPAAPSSAPSGVLDRTAERERIRRERQAIDQSLQHAQAACYQRFAVEDCLRAARRRAREDLAVLRQQESMMDDSERRERAALRLRSIEERQSIRAAEALPASVPRASPRRHRRQPCRASGRRSAIRKPPTPIRRNAARRCSSGLRRSASARQKNCRLPRSARSVFNSARRRMQPVAANLPHPWFPDGAGRAGAGVNGLEGRGGAPGARPSFLRPVLRS